MSAWSALLKSLRKISSWSPKRVSLLKIAFVRLGVLSFLMGYVGLAAVSYYSTLRPTLLTFKIGTCEGTPCVSWVMPAGKAWDQGARVGMDVVSANGQTLVASGLKTPL